MEVSELQFLVLGIIFIINTIVGLAPVMLKGNLPRKLLPKPCVQNRILSCLSCFGAGVFLFVCFMGLLPAADAKFHHFLDELAETDEHWEKIAHFPWGFFTVTIGFLVIFTIDKLVHALENSRSIEKERKISTLLPQTPEEGVKESDSEGGKVSNGQAHEHSHLSEGHGHSHSPGGGHGVPSSVIFLIALGVHSVFEGMAVGLQTQKEKVMELFVAVLVHEVVMAFTFGMEVSKSKSLSRWTKVIYILIFTATIPVGVIAGYGLQNAPSEHREIISAVVEAFATGIFIHVIFIEVLAQEFPGHHHHHSYYHHGNLDKTLPHPPPKKTVRSDACCILEKVGCICLGLLTLILLSVFMHDHH